MDLAFIENEEKIIWARGMVENAERVPFTAVSQLIQGLYLFDDARSLARKRIVVNYEPTVFCRAMVRVAAKRMTRADFTFAGLTEMALSLIEIKPKGMPTRATACRELIEKLPARFENDSAAMRGALCMAAAIPLHEKKYLSARPIAAILTDSEGRVLGAAVNSSERDKTAHAEVNLVQDYYLRTRAMIPSGAKIFSTLKPCRMCAAVIQQSSEDPSAVSLFFAADDPGRLARHTVMEGQLLNL